MGLTEQLELKQITNSYLFANTPKYLYKRLQRIYSIKEFSDHVSLQNLVDEYNRITSEDRKSIEDIALAYALLVTVTFWEYQKARVAFDKFDLSRLKWGEDMKDIFLSSALINTIITISSRLDIPPVDNEVSESTASTSLLDFPVNKYRGGTP